MPYAFGMIEQFSRWGHGSSKLPVLQKLRGLKSGSLRPVVVGCGLGSLIPTATTSGSE
uniref:Uncharacterized protein n=1 Tax=Anguilla anguilla TaxID=7936 RepID=A0A0E9RGL0_ANGAN